MVVYRRLAPDLDLSKVAIITNSNELPNTHEAAEKKAPPGSPSSGAGGAVPKAILICRPNSHPFQERHLLLEQPVKVGRSVARCRAGTSNAIFDCKVLSRNHALLWHENGKFFLQDTKSSNGTFVNNQRLSKGSEESVAREVCSGDIVQFGVDVVENSRKVTHGCIIATLKLFLPDGKEAKASPSTAVIPTTGSNVTTQDLYQLSQCLQEALHREQVLENKLTTLQRVVSTTYDASNASWKALIDEDRLISKIENLESQLLTFAKNVSEEKLKEEILRLQEDKDKYQNSAKESLKKLLQDKLEVVRNLQDLESSLGNTEMECSHLKEVQDTAQRELLLLAEKNDDFVKELGLLNRKLQERTELEEVCEKYCQEKKDLEKQVSVLQESLASMASKLEVLEADRDFANQQLSCLKDVKLKLEENLESVLAKEGVGVKGSDSLLTLICQDQEKEPLKRAYSNEEKRDGTPDEQRQNVYTELKAEVEQLKVEKHDHDLTIQLLACKIILLKELLDESRKKKSILESEILLLKAELSSAHECRQLMESSCGSLRQQLDQLLQKSLDSVEGSLKEKDSEESLEKTVGQEKESKEVSFSQLQDKCNTLRAKISSTEAELNRCQKDNAQLSSEYKELQTSFKSLEELKVMLEAKGDDYWKDELTTTKGKLRLLQNEYNVAVEDIRLLRASCAEKNEKKAELTRELKEAQEELQLLALRSRTASLCSTIPLLVLCIAVVVSLCPYLSYFTATAEQDSSS